MLFVKTRASPPAATELLALLIWYRRSKARFKRLPLRNSPETSTLRSIANLPQELVEMIISYLVYDTRALLACSLTCYSWYIAATPHLHYSLTTYNKGTYPRDKKHRWPEPLKESYKLGLLRFVKRLRIRQLSVEFTPEWLDSSTLCYFSALTNLQELQIQDLQVSSFMPKIQQYFGHFAPALRHLSLLEPKGSCRQILYFIGLFPNLQNLYLYRPLPTEEKSLTNSALAPLSTPPLCGGLTLVCYEGKELVKCMIESFNGLRFRHMHLHEVKYARLLLAACAENLETLRMYPTDSSANIDVVRSHFNLSKNTSLRALETTAKSIAVAGGIASTFLKSILSTIKSPLPLDVVIIHTEAEVGYPIRNETRGLVIVDDISAELRARFVRRHAERFKVFREMHSVREFRLVLRADVLNRAEKHAVETLKRIVEEERLDGGLDFLRERPLIVSKVCGVLGAGVHLDPVRESSLVGKY